MSDASNNAAIAELDDLLERLATLPSVVEEAIPEIAEEFKRRLKASIAAGTTPTGIPWKLTAEGNKPLVGAGEDSKLAVVPLGKAVHIVLKGVEARHHRGTARGRVTRQVIPRGELPPVWRDEVVIPILRKHFRRHMGLGDA